MTFFSLLPNILVLHIGLGKDRYWSRKGILAKVMEKNRVFLNRLSSDLSACLARWLESKLRVWGPVFFTHLASDLVQLT